MGCEPEATPFPVEIPTASPSTPVPTAQSVGQEQAPPSVKIRYGLAPFALPVRDIEQLQTAADVTLLTDMPSWDDLGTRFDLVAAYGELPSASLSPTPLHMALVINPQLPPLDSSAVVSVIRRALNPAVLVENYPIAGVLRESLETVPRATLRTELANAGWPDGFDVMLAGSDTALQASISEQLNPLGILTKPIRLTDNTWPSAHLTVLLWTTPQERAAWVERVGDESLIVDLLTIPISYWAIDGLNITFTSGGWPLVNS